MSCFIKIGKDLIPEHEFKVFIQQHQLRTESFALKKQAARKNVFYNIKGYSGGAIGADTHWHIQIESFVPSNTMQSKFTHFVQADEKGEAQTASYDLKMYGVKGELSPKSSGTIIKSGNPHKVANRAQYYMTNVSRKLGRLADTHITRNPHVIRNFNQIENVKQVFAVGALIPAGVEVKQENGLVFTPKVDQIKGGTGTAVQLAIDTNREVFVYNQENSEAFRKGWYKYNHTTNKFEQTTIPVITGDFAGIGTRNITREGVQAIKDVYLNTAKQRLNSGLFEDKDSSNTATNNLEVSNREYSKESQEVYKALGDKTQTDNIEIHSVYGMAGVNKAKAEEKVFTLRVSNSNRHLGNPFSSEDISIGTVKNAVLSYIDWLLSDTTDVEPERHAFIRGLLDSGALEGKKLIYYKELGEPSHATALDYLINNWKNLKNTGSSNDTSNSNKKELTEREKLVKRLFNSSNKELQAGSVVEYKGDKYIAWRVKEDGKAQLIKTDGTKFSGTPNRDKLNIIGSYTQVEFNNTNYIVTNNENIYSLATGKEVYTGEDNSSKVTRQRIINQALSKVAMTNNNPNDVSDIDNAFKC